MLACLSPWVSAGEALFLGIIMAWLGTTPLEKYSEAVIRYSLQVAVVGLGFGINLQQALSAGRQGFFLTFFSILITLSLGIFLGRKLRLTTHTTFLIAAGTAICGGSAIAALAPLLAAKKEDISVSLGIIFLLNGLALFLFPWIGGHLHLSQHQFGLWSAIAIQDTSSVVAAAASYGSTALKIATTVKLERALWIIPVCLICLKLQKKEHKIQMATESATGESKQRIQIPWFILVFIAVIIMGAYLPGIMHPIGTVALPVAKKLLSVTLFFIGTGFTVKAIKKAGMRPLILGTLLWIFIATLSVLVLIHFT